MNSSERTLDDINLRENSPMRAEGNRTHLVPSSPKLRNLLPHDGTEGIAMEPTLSERFGMEPSLHDYFPIKRNQLPSSPAHGCAYSLPVVLSPFPVNAPNNLAGSMPSKHPAAADVELTAAPPVLSENTANIESRPYPTSPTRSARTSPLFILVGVDTQRLPQADVGKEGHRQFPIEDGGRQKLDANEEKDDGDDGDDDDDDNNNDDEPSPKGWGGRSYASDTSDSSTISVMTIPDPFGINT